MRIVIIAHNQLEIVKRQVELIKSVSKVENGNFILVDNFSSDGMQEWLASLQDVDYIVYDEKLENYAAIINLVAKEFANDEDLLIICPGVILLPGCLDILSSQMDNDRGIGVIYPAILSDNDFSFNDAVQIATERMGTSMHRKLGIEIPVVLLNGGMLSAIGGLDEKINSAVCVYVDMCFRSIKENYMCCEATGAFAYKFSNIVNYFGTVEDYNKDMSYLRDKWGMNYFFSNPHTAMLEMIDEPKDKEFSVLEVGCDCGANLLWVENTFKNVKISGIEINPVSAEIASHLFDVAACDIEKREKPFGETKFDYIIFGDVLEHLRNPAGVIDFCKELLKPKGKILASIPNLQHYSVMDALLNGEFHYTDTGLLDKTHIHFFTYKEIRKMFSDAKYDILRMECTVTADEEGRKDEIIKRLMSVAREAQPFMFEAFQYIVLAATRE